MDTYTFRTILENVIVTLPVEYKDKLVEITIREVVNPSRRKRDLLSPISIDTSGWKWNREEANERR